MFAFRFHLSLLLLGLCTGLWPGLSRADQEPLARKLINSQGCKACHTFERAGNQLAGSLEELCKGLGQEQIRRALISPTRTHGNGRIPDFRHLHPEELDALVNFLKKHAQP